jgi:peptidoglycan/LPS O-acetylase OafA/YrhL
MVRRLKRRHDIDWLRVLAVLLLVPFHSALIFSLAPDDIVYVKDQVESPILIQFAYFVHLWHMPLLFVLAGASTWFALRFRTAGKYLEERFLRLVIPLVFACTTLIPLMIYVQFLDKPDFDSFWQFYAQFFRIDFGDLSGYSGTFTPSHLWFVLFLFVFSVVALPLFLYLGRESGRRLIAALATFFERRWAIFVLALPLAIAVALVDVGGKAPLLYLSLFIYGYVWAADARFQGIVDRHRISALALGVIFTVAFHVLVSVGGNRVLIHILYYFSRWCWLIAILGFGRRWLSRSGRLLSYLSEASYPFYILHMPINTIVGFFVIQWPVGVAVKYLVINVVTILATYAVYEVLVKRVGVTRFLFGMKPKRCRTRHGLPHAVRQET